ncbi:hypothetical protein EDB84DRAFT_1561826 [Lactarius hengduanensis]|nr:hypothetical protein EDB84DRAFT_1561826 [Lactarius hengduanensis]
MDRGSRQASWSADGIGTGIGTCERSLAQVPRLRPAPFQPPPPAKILHESEGRGEIHVPTHSHAPNPSWSALLGVFGRVFLDRCLSLSPPPHRQHSRTSPSSLSPPPPSSPTFTPLPTATSSATLVLTWRPYNELVGLWVTVPDPDMSETPSTDRRSPSPLVLFRSRPLRHTSLPQIATARAASGARRSGRASMWVVLQHPRRLVVSRGRVHRGRRVLDDIVCEGPHVARSHAAVGRASRFLVSRRLTVVLLAALDPQAPSTPHTPSFAPYP